MRIMIKNYIAATIMTFSIIPMIAKGNPLATNCLKAEPEARGLRGVECPAFWPINKNSPLTAAQYFNYPDTPDPAPCVDVTKEEKTFTIAVAGPTDLGCDYANGPQLLISVPGTPVECQTRQRERPGAGQLADHITCYFKPSGDPSKDKVIINELQELTYDTEIFGLRLSMTRAELEVALKAAGARIVPADGETIHASLADGKEIAAFYTSEGHIREIDADASHTDDNLYPALKHRFGLPQQIDEPGKSPWSTFWVGAPNIRLEIDFMERVPSFSRRLRLIDLDQTK